MRHKEDTSSLEHEAGYLRPNVTGAARMNSFNYYEEHLKAALSVTYHMGVPSILCAVKPFKIVKL